MTTPEFIPTRIFDLIKHQSLRTPTLSIFNYYSNGEWIGVSTKDFQARVNELSKGLIALGIQPNEKVALISENRLEWNLVDFAIQQVGAVVVAIYPNISESDYQFILNDAAANVLFISNKNLVDKLKSIEDKLSVKHWFSFEQVSDVSLYSDLIQLGASVSDEVLQARMDAVQADDLATLIYTSGTTGHPKGVMLSHENLMTDVLSSEYSFPVTAYDKSLSFLPACHAYERVFQYVYIKMGLSIYYARSLDTLGEDMAMVKPQIFSAVPRVLEKVYEKIMAKGAALTGIKKALFDWSILLGEKYEQDPTKRSVWYNFQLAIARKLVFSKWQEALGGHIKGIASGSATLQPKLAQLFLAAGINIYEGYGLTEAGPCLSVNCHRRGTKIGTVGLPLINMEIKLAEDGEVLAKGKNIMKGYYKNPEATAEVLKDGWLHTGDIGEWDGPFLKIVDRKKEMFKTSGGKYIVPQQMEAKFGESRFIQQIMIVGEGRKFASALIVPAYDYINDWLKSTQKSIQDFSAEELIKNVKVREKIEEEIQRINNYFGNWERIKAFSLLPAEFSIENNELTPTLKMKRKIIEQKYYEIIEQFYTSKMQVQ